MANGRIDENGLPVYAPGDYDYVRVVDRSTGASRNALAPEVTAAARVLSESVENIVEIAESHALDSINKVQLEASAVLAGIGYLPPTPYASGLNVDSTRFTVIRDGQVYAPAAPVPFTTGTWNSSQWRLVQGVTSADLSSEYGAGMIGFRGGTVDEALSVAESERNRILSDVAGPALSGSRLINKGPAGNMSERRPMLVISYDDASDTIYEYAWPVHKAEGVPGIFYVTAGIMEGVIGTNFTPVTTWDRLREMHFYQGPGRIEIGNHSWDHPRYGDITAEEVEYQVVRSNEVFAKHGLHPRHMAYPHNSNSAIARSVVSNYFESARSSSAILADSHIPAAGTPAFIAYRGRMNPFSMPSLDADPATMATMKSYVDAIKDNNAFGFLYFHHISPTINNTPAKLQEIIQYAKSQGVEITTPDEVLRSHGPDAYYNRRGTELWDNEVDKVVHLPGGPTAFKYLLLCEDFASTDPDDALHWAGQLHFLGDLRHHNSAGAGVVNLSFSRGAAGVQVHAVGAYTQQAVLTVNTHFDVVRVAHAGSHYVAIRLTAGRSATSVRVLTHSVNQPWNIEIRGVEASSVSDIAAHQSDRVLPIQHPGNEAGDFDHGRWLKHADGTLEYELMYPVGAIPAGGSMRLDGQWPVPFVASEPVFTGGVYLNSSSSPADARNSQLVFCRSPAGSILTHFSIVVFNNSDTPTPATLRCYGRAIGRWRV